MNKGEKSVRNNIQDFLCPFTDFYLTCGPNESKYHMGTMAIDVRGIEAGVRYPYYAPADVKCIRTYPESGQVMWQTMWDVRCSNGYIGKVTFMTVHDDTMDAYPELVVPQGNQLGNMGTKGNATGVHCHIECSQSSDTSWIKNGYGNWCFRTEIDPEDVFFMDNTNILHGIGNWKYLKDVPVENVKYINLPPKYIDERNIYDINTKEKLPYTLKVKKYNGLTYKILEFIDNNLYAKIETCDYGQVLVRITDKTPITTTPTYEHGNY